MNVTKNEFKDRQPHIIEDYLQMVSAEQKEYAEVSKEPEVPIYSRIAENNDIITDISDGTIGSTGSKKCKRLEFRTFERVVSLGGFLCYNCSRYLINFFTKSLFSL